MQYTTVESAGRSVGRSVECAVFNDEFLQYSYFRILITVTVFSYEVIVSV